MESDHQGIFIPVKRKRNPNLKFSPKQQVSKKRKLYFVARCPSVVFAKMNCKTSIIYSFVKIITNIYIKQIQLNIMF